MPSHAACSQLSSHQLHQTLNCGPTAQRITLPAALQLAFFFGGTQLRKGRSWDLGMGNHKRDVKVTQADGARREARSREMDRREGTLRREGSGHGPTRAVKT